MTFQSTEQTVADFAQFISGHQSHEGSDRVTFQSTEQTPADFAQFITAVTRSLASPPHTTTANPIHRLALC